MNELSKMIDWCDTLIEEVEWLEYAAKVWCDAYGIAVE